MNELSAGMARLHGLSILRQIQNLSLYRHINTADSIILEDSQYRLYIGNEFINNCNMRFMNLTSKLKSILYLLKLTSR